jgi:hypothetical protein
LGSHLGKLPALIVLQSQNKLSVRLFKLPNFVIKESLSFATKWNVGAFEQLFNLGIPLFKFLY